MEGEKELVFISVLDGMKKDPREYFFSRIDIGEIFSRFFSPSFSLFFAIPFPAPMRRKRSFKEARSSDLMYVQCVRLSVRPSVCLSVHLPARSQSSFALIRLNRKKEKVFSPSDQIMMRIVKSYACPVCLSVRFKENEAVKVSFDFILSRPSLQTLEIPKNIIKPVYSILMMIRNKSCLVHLG